MEPIAEMRDALKHTWYPFLARFPCPTPVQLAAFKPLLSGRDCLVCSPSATGKTEAIVAPLVERHLESGATSLPAILVVSPTRALVNDLVRRLQEPLAVMGLRVHRRTGDHAVLDRRNPPQVLVTTPESLDSLLVRQTSFLRDVRALMLDELHILDGSARGDQLAILIERLRALLGRLQCVASSATLHDPGGVAERYLSEEAEHVFVEKPREFSARWLRYRSREDLLSSLASLWSDGQETRKILVFLDRRADVEELASHARGHGRLGNRVYAHHGSLSRSERERVEARFLADPSAVCFATMTLELGIDIGDVDLVVLVGPPPSVSAFLQRMGRGNRRTGAARLLGFYFDQGELVCFRHLEELARKGDLCTQAYVFRPSVLVQQAGSLLLQSSSGWLTAPVLRGRLARPIRERFGNERLDELLAALCHKDWLKTGRHGRYYPGERLHQAFERRNLHANLQQDPGTLEVIDENTGQSIGLVAAASEKQRMAIGGRGRTVLRLSEDKVFVKSTNGPAVASRFSPRGRRVMSREMARSLARFLGLSGNRLPLVETPSGLALFHFEGTLAGELLAHHLKKSHRWPVKKCTSLTLIMEEPFPQKELPPIQPDAIERDAMSIGTRLSKLASAGPFHRFLPASWHKIFLGDVLPYEELARSWSHAPIERQPPGDLCDTMVALGRLR